MNSAKTKKIIMTALFAAIIAVCTRFTAFPIPGTSGYVHLGDAFVFLSAACLPAPYSLIASALGGMLADFMYGSLIYVIPTAIVKALMTLCFFGKKEKKLFAKKSIVSCIFGIIALVAGYYIAEVIIFGSFIAPLTGIIWNAAQGIFSAILFAVVAVALDASNIMKKM